MTAGAKTPGAGRPILLVLFFGSGCAALIYELVWLQLLQFIIGSSAISIGVLLGTFMGGMCLGSLFFPNVFGQRRHPLRVYASLEVGIAVVALVIVYGLPFGGAAMGLGGGVPARLVIAAVCLLPPTVMIGATWPAIARWVESTATDAAWLGVFYAGNLAGAVAGSVAAGFYLLRVHDAFVATWVAVTINVLVACGSVALARTAPYDEPAAGPRSAIRRPRNARLVYTAIGVSGFTALSCEVIWTRLLSLAVGATVYAFSLILAVFLSGLGIGGWIGAGVGRRVDKPLVALAWCQCLLCLAIASGAYLLADVIPYWSVTPVVRASTWLTVQTNFFRSGVVVLPGALLWGVSFPLALVSLASPGEDPGQLAGRVYAANTIGAIGGSLATSLLLVASLGSQHAQQVLIGLSAASGVAVFWFKGTGLDRRKPRPVASRSSHPIGVRSCWASAVALAGVAGAAVLAWSVPPIPGALVAYGRRSADWVSATTEVNAGKMVYVGEGLNAFVAVSRAANGELNYHAAGKVQASTRAEDMRLQLMLAHFSSLMARQAGNVLVIGCGAGITAGALALGSGVEHVTIAEIERLVPHVAATYFGDYNYHILEDPRVVVRIDDGRHFLTTTTDTFDVITTDMIDPWVKGVATLFTREFFDTAKRHLRPGGVVTQFVQLYQSSPDAVKSEVATFVEAFPNSIIWGNPVNGQGYDLVLMGQVDPIQIDVDRLQARLEQPESAATAASLRAIGIDSAVQLLATYAGSGADLSPWLRDAMINRDRNLRLQYLAGLGVDLDESAAIYADMLQHARFPDRVFTGRPASLQALREEMARARRSGAVPQ